MAGLDTRPAVKTGMGVDAGRARLFDRDGRVKPGHDRDEVEALRSSDRPSTRPFSRER
jgi:hypothetical protein